MSIRVLYGRGGSGKSMYQMHILVEQLRESKRNICTNLAVDVPKLNAYLERKYPSENLRLVNRLRILTVEETREFWKYRGPRRWRPGSDYDLEDDPGTEGVCYIIDEAGAAGFSAQEWASKTQSSTRGVECTWYLDQQRKFGDDVYASTNGSTPGEIAKGFRAKAHEFVRLKNEYLAQWGMFRGRGRFLADFFVREPDKTTEAFRRVVFNLDKDGLADCYHTAQGVGVSGTKADVGARAKGIPILWVIPLGIALASLAGLVPWLLGKGAGSYISGAGSQELAQKTAGLVGAGKPAAASVARSDARMLSDGFGVVSGVTLERGALRVAVLGRGWLSVTGAAGPDALMLSDGTLVRRRDVVTGGGVSEALASRAAVLPSPADS